MAAFYTDEDVAIRLVRVLHTMGHIATSARGEGQLGESDSEHLAYAASRGWTMITRNAKHYRRLHEQWLAEEKMHAGVVTFDRVRSQTVENIAACFVEFLAMPELVLENQFYRWRGNNQWRQYPDDKG